MILLDVDDTDSIHKANDRYYGSTVRLPESAAANIARRSDVCSLPDYDTSEHQFRVQQQEIKTPIPFYARWTFWRAVLFSLLVYSILSVAIAVPIVTKLQKERRQTEDKSWSTNSLWSKKSDTSADGGFDEVTQKLETPWAWKGPPSQNASCEQFIYAETNGTAANYTHSFLSAQWSLSGQGPIISVRSNHSYDLGAPSAISGKLTVDVIPSNSTEEAIKFFVQINATSLRLSNHDILCFRSSGSFRGLTIYLPDPILAVESVEIDINVLIPNSSIVPHFETYLPQFNHTFGDLEQANVGTLVVEGASAPISFKSVKSKSVTVKNVLDCIKGKFNVTSDLSLDVMQGAIEADVTLFRNPSSPSSAATNLAIDSGFSPVDVNVTLGADIPRLTGQNIWTKFFATRVKSCNGAVRLNLTHASELDPTVMAVEVQNSLGHTYVRLDPKYQGDFDAHSQLGHVRVLNGDQELPAVTSNYTLASQNRRMVCDRHFRDRVIGWIGREEHRPVTTDDYRQTMVSSVDIRSSIGAVTLDFS